MAKLQIDFDGNWKEIIEEFFPDFQTPNNQEIAVVLNKIADLLEVQHANPHSIGEELAERIVKVLDVRTLEELEQAAHDGRLAQIEGFGKKRIEGVQISLAGMLSGYAQRRMKEMNMRKREKMRI